MTHDHRIPKSRGGSHGLENALGLCGNCNTRKNRKAWPQFVAEEAKRATELSAKEWK